MPRDTGENRKLTCRDARHVTAIAHGLGRIDERRYQLVLSTLFLLEQVELENK